MFIYRFDLADGRLSGVGQQAGIGNGVSRQGGDIRGGDPDIGQALGYAELPLECGDGRKHGFFLYCRRRIVREIRTEQPAERCVAVGHGVVIVSDDMVKQNGVAKAMGQVEQPAQAVGHGMDRAQDGVGKCHAGIETRQDHAAPGLEVVRARGRGSQVGAYQPHRLQGQQVGHGAVGV